MAKEIIHTIKVRGNILHGILDEDSMTFVAVGCEKYGGFSTTMNIQGLPYEILKQTIIEWDDSVDNER